MTRLLLVAAALLPAAAAARCLTAADLESGIRIGFSNADWTTIRSLGEGVMEWEEYYAGRGNGSRFVGYLAIYPMSGDYSVLDPTAPAGDRVRYTYPVEPTTLPVPDPAAPEWSGTVQFSARGPDAPGENEELHVFRFLRAADLELSGCSYEVVGVEAIQFYDPGVPGGDGWEMLYYYLPALGAGFVVASRSFGNPGWSWADPVSIEPIGTAAP